MKSSTVLTDESFWFILLHENGVLIPLTTELDENFSGVDGSLKPSVEKITPIRDLLPWKTTASVGYDAVRSYEWLLLSETISWYSQEYIDKLL